MVAIRLRSVRADAVIVDNFPAAQKILEGLPALGRLTFQDHGTPCGGRALRWTGEPAVGVRLRRAISCALHSATRASFCRTNTQNVPMKWQNSVLFRWLSNDLLRIL